MSNGNNWVTCCTIEKRTSEVPPCFQFDCPLREDESDCYALTNGESVGLDINMRPEVYSEGMLSFNKEGNWHNLCNSHLDDPLPAADICAYLGFTGYEFYNNTYVTKQVLKFEKNAIPYVNTENYLNPMAYPVHFFDGYESRYKKKRNSNGFCNGLHVVCLTTLKGFFHIPGSEDYEWPWHGQVYVEGVYKSSAVLLDKRWLLTSRKHFEDIL